MLNAAIADRFIVGRANQDISEGFSWKEQLSSFSENIPMSVDQEE